MTERSIVDRLLDHQRAELGRAEGFRSISLVLQVAVAVAAAFSVFVDDHNQLLWLAVVSVLVLGTWFVTDYSTAAIEAPVTKLDAFS